MGKTYEIAQCDAAGDEPEQHDDARHPKDQEPRPSHHPPRSATGTLQAQTGIRRTANSGVPTTA